MGEKRKKERRKRKKEKLTRHIFPNRETEDKCLEHVRKNLGVERHNGEFVQGEQGVNVKVAQVRVPERLGLH